MSVTEIDCARIEAGDLEARYLSDRLTDEEAEAFEAHYFACDKCWTSLQRAIEMRAALTNAVGPAAATAPDALQTHRAHNAGFDIARDLTRTSVPDVRRADRHGPADGVAYDATRARRSRRWWPLAAAASVAVVVAGVWRMGGTRPPGGAGTEVVRGANAALSVHATVVGTDLRAAWPHVAQADIYRVRLFTASGTLVLERETPDTSIAVVGRALASVQDDSFLYWEIEALDPLRHVVARSPLTRAPRAPDSR